MNNDTTQFYCSQWGYDQTNVTFYKVIKRTAKTVTVIEVNSKREYTRWGQYVAVPAEESPSWAKAMRKKIHNNSITQDPEREFLDISSFANAYRWDGKAVEGTCYA